jgi:ERCC4-type nuclease
MIDQREPQWVQRLSFGGVPTSITLLDTGDVHVACDDGTLILVERKSPDDFLSTLRDERLFPQCARMLGVTRWAYLVITGEFRRGASGKVVTDRETGWSYAAVQGALLSLQEMGIFVVFSGGDADFEPCIMRLAERHHSAQTLLTPPRPPQALGIATAFLCGFPGLGPERAQKLIDYCGSVKLALVALTGPDPIPGIPSNIKRNARLVLGLDEAEQLMPLVNEVQS